MNKYQNILQVTRRAPTWGFDLSRQIALAYKNQSYSVTTVFFSGKKNNDILSGYPGEIIFLDLNLKHPMWRIIAFVKLLGLSRRKFDVLFCHHYKPTAIMGLVNVFARIKRCYSINHNIGNYRRAGRRIFAKYFLNKSWGFIAVSEYCKQDLIAAGLPAENITAIPKCIDIEQSTAEIFSESKARTELNVSDEDFVFGIIGRLDPSKGHIYLLHAFESLINKGIKNIKLVIIGHGPLEDELKALLPTDELKKNVIFTGLKLEASKYLSAFNVFIGASIAEPFGLVITEAMSARVPIIVTSGGAYPEVVGPDAVIVEPKNPNALAEAMEKLYHMPQEQRRAMGDALYKRVQEKFSLKLYHQRFQALLEKRT